MGKVEPMTQGMMGNPNRVSLSVHEHAQMLISPAHLDDVSRNDELRWSGFTLLARWAGGSQTKHPLHLVPQALLALLLVHGLTDAWRSTQAGTDGCLNKRQHAFKTFRVAAKQKEIPTRVKSQFSQIKIKTCS